MNIEDIKVGEYLMHHMGGGGRGTLVRIQGIVHPGRYSVEYMDGGSSSSWEAECFRPITDPKSIAIARAHALRRMAKDHAYNAKKCSEDASIWEKAVEAIKEAQNAVGEGQ